VRGAFGGDAPGKADLARRRVFRSAPRLVIHEPLADLFYGKSFASRSEGGCGRAMVHIVVLYGGGEADPTVPAEEEGPTGWDIALVRQRAQSCGTHRVDACRLLGPYQGASVMRTMRSRACVRDFGAAVCHELRN
jgi:hypothetical protein